MQVSIDREGGAASQAFLPLELCQDLGFLRSHNTRLGFGTGWTAPKPHLWAYMDRTKKSRVEW